MPRMMVYLTDAGDATVRELAEKIGATPGRILEAVCTMYPETVTSWVSDYEARLAEQKALSKKERVLLEQKLRRMTPEQLKGLLKETEGGS
jgi:hypothetical protein